MGFFGCVCVYIHTHTHLNIYNIGLGFNVSGPRRTCPELQSLTTKARTGALAAAALGFGLGFEEPETVKVQAPTKSPQT